jgi:hypothetical protein
MRSARANLDAVGKPHGFGPALKPIFLPSWTPAMISTHGRKDSCRGQDELHDELEVLAAALEGGAITAEKVARGAFSRRWA